MSQETKVGFIGLGMMGYPMAARLVGAGFTMFVNDADEARVSQFMKEHGGNPLKDADAEKLNVVITMLPNSNIVESVLLGADKASGIVGKLQKGAVVIDMSSSEPARSRDLGKLLSESGLQYLDAPVSGGVKKATSGDLAILVGGEASLLQTSRALFDAVGAKILHIGPAGAGHAAKALNNYVSATGLAATVEALHIAERFGVPPESMTDVLNASTGRTNTSETKVKQFMLSGSFGSGFALKLMAKDLNIAKSLAQAVGYDMQLGATSIELWSKAAEHANKETDHTEMYKLLKGKL